LGYLFDAHTLHTKLLCLNAPSMMTPYVAFDSHQNPHRRVLRPNSIENMLSGSDGCFFKAQSPNRCEYRTTCVSHTSWTLVPPVLDRTDNTACSDTSSRWCVSQVSTTAAGHPMSNFSLDKLCQSHHSIGRKMMELDSEMLQDFDHKTMNQQSKTSNKKASNLTSFPFGSGTSSTHERAQLQIQNTLIVASPSHAKKSFTTSQTPLYAPPTTQWSAVTC
jgi:hypothetical protein